MQGDLLYRRGKEVLSRAGRKGTDTRATRVHENQAFHDDIWKID